MTIPANVTIICGRLVERGAMWDSEKLGITVLIENDEKLANLTPVVLLTEVFPVMLYLVTPWKGGILCQSFATPSPY